jgi:glycosyltransferase involved in cell wall biosynthesis
MKVSYLVTVSNEGHSVVHLFNKILETGLPVDELVILEDPHNQINGTGLAIVHAFEKLPPIIPIKRLQHKLDKNYGAHKNYGIENCSGDFIFQIDGDEMPPDALLGENLHALLESNPTIESYAVPRINDFKGVTQAHAAQWGWKLTESPTYKRPVVNFPDYQFRIFKRDYPRISFLRRLHEKIEGYASYVALPATEEYALYHDKTIETQIQTNLRYNEWFTQAENKGHSVFTK